MSAALRQDLDDARKVLAEWRALALAAQAQVKHQSGMRESELVSLLKDILHCSDVFVTFWPDLHARLLAFAEHTQGQALAHVASLSVGRASELIDLPPSTHRNLELTQTLRMCDLKLTFPMKFM